MKGLGSLNLFLKISNYLKTCSTRFPETQNTLLHPELSHRVLKVKSWSNTGVNLCRSRWQIPSLLLLFSDWQILLASASLSLTGKCQFVADRCSLKKDSMVSVCFQGKPFNITVIQVYAPTSNAEEVEVEWPYEDLQDLLELTPKKRCPFHHRRLEYKSRKSRDT